MRTILAIMALTVAAFGQSYPSSVYTPLVASNNISTVLNVNQLVGDNVAIVASTTGWAANMPLYICDVVTGTGTAQKCTTFEIELVTSVSGANVLNVTRGYGGTVALAHAAGKVAGNSITAVYIKSVNDEVLAIETALGANLSHVVLPGGNNAFTGANSHSGTETFTGTLDARSAAHTLPIKTGLASAIPATCSVGETYFATDATAGQNIYLCTSTNTFTQTTTLPAAAAQLQYLRTKPNSGNLTTYEFANPSNTRNTTDFAFPAQTPGGSISAGSNTISMVPCPLGLNGSDTNHHLYLSAGTGTAESVIVTGGSCTAGASAGTIVVTAANSHSGAWTVQSANGGLSEAYQDILTNSSSIGAIKINAPLTMHAGVVAKTSADRVAFIGQGRDAYNLVIRAQDFAAGDLFHNDVHGCWYFFDLGMQNGLPTPGSMTGSAVYVGPGQVQINSMTILNGQFGIRLVGADTSTLNNVAQLNLDFSFKAIAGISLENLCDNIWITNSIAGGPLSGNANLIGAGIRILAADGVWMDNNLFSADTGIQISAVNNYIANVFIAGGGVDGARTFGVAFSAVAPIINVRFSNVHLAAQSDGTTLGLGPVVYFDPTVGAGLMGAVSFTGGEITSGAVEGVSVAAAGDTEITFNGVEINDNNRSNTAGTAALLAATGVTGLTVNGCVFGNNLGLGHQKYAVKAAGTLEAIITSNRMLNNDGGTILLGGAFTGTIFGNMGVDTVVPVVASASSVALPVNSQFTMTGTTGVATVTGQWIGKTGDFVTTSGAVVFTANPTIGNTCTTTINKPYHYFSDGTKVWISGAGC